MDLAVLSGGQADDDDTGRPPSHPPEDGQSNGDPRPDDLPLETVINPFDQRDTTNALTNFHAAINIVKGSMGSGILAMGQAFLYGGLVFSVFATIMICILCTYCMHLVVRCTHYHCRRLNKPHLTYAETAEACFSIGPRWLRKWAPYAKYFILLALFLTYFSGSTVYIVLDASMLKQVLEERRWFTVDTSMTAMINWIAIFFVFFGMINNIKILTWFSKAGILCILTGLVLTMWHVVLGGTPLDTFNRNIDLLPPISSVQFMGSPGKLPLFFSIVLFAMECIGLVHKVESKMRHPEDLLGMTGVINKCMVFIGIVYTASGFLGYWRYGEMTLASLTLNLPSDTYNICVKILIMVSVLLSYSLQYGVAVDIAWLFLEKLLLRFQAFDPEKLAVRIYGTSDVAPEIARELEKKTDSRLNKVYIIMRFLLLVIAHLVANSVPNLGPLTSLVGSIFYSILGLMCPAVMDLITFWDDELPADCSYVNTQLAYDPTCIEFGGKDGIPSPPRRSLLSLWTRPFVVRNILIVIASILALAFGSYASILDIQQLSIENHVNTTISG